MAKAERAKRVEMVKRMVMVLVIVRPVNYGSSW
jgi:hypothetical protein